MNNQTAKQKLLGKQNAKTIKGEKLGYETYIMYLSPFNKNSKGINLCSHASAGCASACLFESGRGSFSSVMTAREKKTEYFLNFREKFLFQLKSEIEQAIKSAEKSGKKLAIRLNGTSDIVWEKFKVFEGKNIFEIFPNTQFYDYSKNYFRFEKQLPTNYHLTFSRSETNEQKSLEILRKGHNVAMVFDKLPDSYNGYKVINGDETDLRFLDERGGIIVGLKYKKLTGKGAKEKNAAALTDGFVIKNNEFPSL